METLLIKAADFAAFHHRHQQRKGAEKTPYINHLIRVTRLLAETGRVSDPELLAAALLHDTVEDTAVTLDEIEEQLGGGVGGGFGEVTDDRSLAKEERKRQQVEHAPHLTPGAAQIKLADKIDNVLEMKQNPPADWPAERQTAYIEWGKEVVRALPVVNPPLLALFTSIVEQQ